MHLLKEAFVWARGCSTSPETHAIKVHCRPWPRCAECSCTLSACMREHTCGPLEPRPRARACNTTKSRAARTIVSRYPHNKFFRSLEPHFPHPPHHIRVNRYVTLPLLFTTFWYTITKVLLQKHDSSFCKYLCLLGELLYCFYVFRFKFPERAHPRCSMSKGNKNYTFHTK